MKINDPEMFFQNLASLHDCSILGMSLDNATQSLSVRIDDIYCSVIPSRHKQPAELIFSEVGRLLVDIGISKRNGIMISSTYCERLEQNRYEISFDLIYGIPEGEYSKNTRNISFTFSHLIVDLYST